MPTVAVAHEDAGDVGMKTRDAWFDAWRGARRVASVLAIPEIIGWVEARGVEKLPWLVFVPAWVFLLACAVGGLVGWRRAARLRVLLAPLGWPLAARVGSRAIVGGTKLFPFDERRRASGDGGVGRWGGRPAAVFAYGARTLVHALVLAEPLPALQLVPVGTGGAFDVGTGRSIDVEVATISKKWRIVAPDARFAHAALPPTVLAVLDAIPEPRPIIAIDGRALWTADRGVRLTRTASVDRLTVLAAIADGVPSYVATDFAAATQAGTQSAFFSGNRQKNSLARMSVLLGLTPLTGLFGIWVGVRALRACADGTASNRRVALLGICLSVAATLLLAVMTVVAFTVDG